MARMEKNCIGCLIFILMSNFCFGECTIVWQDRPREFVIKSLIEKTPPLSDTENSIYQEIINIEPEIKFVSSEIEYTHLIDNTPFLFFGHTYNNPVSLDFCRFRGAIPDTETLHNREAFLRFVLHIVSLNQYIVKNQSPYFLKTASWDREIEELQYWRPLKELNVYPPIRYDTPIRGRINFNLNGTEIGINYSKNLNLEDRNYINVKLQERSPIISDYVKSHMISVISRFKEEEKVLIEYGEDGTEEECIIKGQNSEGTELFFHCGGKIDISGYYIDSKNKKHIFRDIGRAK